MTKQELELEIKLDVQKYNLLLGMKSTIQDNHNKLLKFIDEDIKTAIDDIAHRERRLKELFGA